MKIAVIGGGTAGLVTAWLLESDHEVTLYEKEARLGGHADTHTVEVAGKSVAIDAGFEFFSATMYPTFIRLLNLLNVPLHTYPMTISQVDTRTGDVHLLPPFHGLRIFPEMLTPRKVCDLLRFRRVIVAARDIMERRDTSVTTEQFLDSIPMPERFKYDFMYPFFQGNWGVSLDEIKSFMIYDVARYTYLNLPAGIAPRDWVEVVGGMQTYVATLHNSLKATRIQSGTSVTAVRTVDDGYMIDDANGGSEAYDHVVLATNASQAAEAIAAITDTQEIRRLLNQITYFDTTIAVHGDVRLMPPQRKHWSVVNVRFDGTYSQMTIWKAWKSQMPVFRSWITHDDHLPDPLYALVKYRHPRINAAYFGAQKALQAYQGVRNLWLAGMHMHDVDSHESAVISAVKVAQALAPNSPRLKQLHPAV
ncbi:MAG: FAD-dependent oxidoreductase [Anaerolineae bacterium]|nr:FAD-dependent oxidoreductase [Anaerolineae bacterium]